MSALPNQVNYSEPLLMLPENTTNFLVAALPTNGSTFGPGTIAQVDLTTNRGFLDPASIPYGGTGKDRRPKKNFFFFFFFLISAFWHFLFGLF